MFNFTSVSRMLDDMTRFVDDIIEVECQVHDQYNPIKTYSFQSQSKPSLSEIVTKPEDRLKPKKKLKKADIDLIKNLMLTPIPPCSNPKPKRIRRKERSKNNLKLAKPTVLLPFTIPGGQQLEPILTKSAPVAILDVPKNNRDDVNRSNPFVSISKGEDGCDGSTPLTMYSYFQIPLEIGSEIPSIDSGDASSDNDTDTSSESGDSLGLGSPPLTLVLHRAVFKEDPTSANEFELSPDFKLRFERDRLIAKVDKDKAYFIKYANSLVQSRSECIINGGSILNKCETIAQIKDCHNICTPVCDDGMRRMKLLLEYTKFDGYQKGRDIRPNSSGWRMLASEFDMIYANKIVRPLKPRAYLPPKCSPFTKVSSPLRQVYTAKHLR